jgi:MFS family permease
LPEYTSTEGPVVAGAPLRAWGVVGLLWIAFLINYVDRQVVFSIFPVLRRELGFRSEQLGLIGGIFIWVYSLVNPFVGRLADVVSRRLLILSSLVLWSLATLGTGSSGGVASFLAWRAVMGLTEGMYVPPALAVIATLHGSATRSRALALHSTAQFAGIVLGSWFGGWMADRHGWRNAFVLLAVLGCAYVPLLAAGLRGAAVQPAGTRRLESAPVGALLRNGTYLGLSLAFFFLCVMLWMIYAWLPNHVYERMGLSMADAGLTASFWVQTGSIAGTLGGSYLADRLALRFAPARYLVVCVGLVLCAPFAWLTFAAASLAPLRAAAWAFGFFAGLMAGNVFAACCDVMPAAAYGLGTGTLNMIGGLSAGAGIFVAGRLKETLGIPSLMKWTAALAVAAALLLAAIVRARFERDFASAGPKPA